MKDIDASIVQKVKDAIGFHNTVTELELLKILQDARVQKHPDKYQDEEAKNKAEEDFKKLSALLSEYRSYLDRKKAALLPVQITENQSELQRFEQLNNEIGLQEKIFKLKQEVKTLGLSIKEKENLINKLQATLNDKRAVELENFKEELKKVYTIKKSRQYIGVGSIMLFILSKLSFVKGELANVFGGSSSYIQPVLLSVIIIFLLRVLYSKLSLKVVTDIISSMTNIRNISMEVEIQSRKVNGYYRNTHYFLESDLQRSIEKKLRRFPYRLLFIFSANEAIDSVTKQVIMELINKKLIEFGKSIGFDRMLLVQNPKIEETDPGY